MIISVYFNINYKNTIKLVDNKIVTYICIKYIKMFSKNLQFRISAGLKNIIGRDLITDDFVAIFELVKNSFDAYASEVNVTFELVNSFEYKIIIKDNGKGMDFNDLLNKWLFVAYSAKHEGTEDDNYRHKINLKKYYAGAKGIGRFSCDRLGKRLKLTTTKDEPNAKTEIITVDWEEFEKNIKEEFTNVNVDYTTLDANPYGLVSGTVLEIYDLRDNDSWDREKLLKLKRSLAKLINPFKAAEFDKFKIFVNVPKEKNQDLLEVSQDKKVNGFVINSLLNLLELKTTRITSLISSDGKIIETELFDAGNLIYQITEKNTFTKLKDIFIEIYFLSQKAKINFTKSMGMTSRDYGSIFMFKNGIRIFPYGEPEQDPLGLDDRRTKKLGDYVGTNDIIGQIEISGDNNGFKETTSRGDGLIKNDDYLQLHSFFLGKVIERLESFRKNVVRFGIDFETLQAVKGDIRSTFKILTDEVTDENLIKIKLNESIISLILTSQNDSESTRSLLRNIKEIAQKSNNNELNQQIRKVEKKLDEAFKVAIESEQLTRKIEKDLSQQVSQNLFLKATRNTTSDELLSLMHHIGIASNNINSELDYLLFQVDQKKDIDIDELRQIIRSISEENQKIFSITKIATKTNFKVNANEQTLNLIEFVIEYISNISINYFEGLKISIDYKTKTVFPYTFRPIEMMIVIDNLISNSRKANATNIIVTIDKFAENELKIIFKDDGIGVPLNIADNIFELGFTTTTGSGLGLTHVREILERINAKIYINKQIKEGSEFIINFKK